MRIISFWATTDFQLVFNFEQTHIVTIFGEHGSGSYTRTVKPIRALELHYPMIQFLITIMNILCPGKSYSKMYGTEPRYNNLQYND